MDTLAFTAEMEARFGSDEALGVWFEADDGSRYTPAELDAWNKQNPSGELLETISYLPGGGSACCCTDYAAHIFRALPGRVKIYGFANEENPTSRVARELIHPGGHDFAVVDDRFVVDPWLRLVSGVLEQLVFDMQGEQDAALVADLYGPQHCWTHMLAAEEYAASQA